MKNTLKEIKGWFHDLLVEKRLIEPNHHVFIGTVTTYGSKYGFINMGARDFHISPLGRQQVVVFDDFKGELSITKFNQHRAGKGVKRGDKVVFIDSCQRREGQTPHSWFWIRLQEVEAFIRNLEDGFFLRVIESHAFKKAPRGMAVIGKGRSAPEVQWIGLERSFLNFLRNREGEEIFEGPNYRFERWDTESRSWVERDRPLAPAPESKKKPGKSNAPENSATGSNEHKSGSGAGGSVGAAFATAEVAKTEKVADPKPKVKKRKRKAKGIPSAV